MAQSNKDNTQLFEDLYDLLMYDIEQDLLIENLQEAMQERDGENDEQRAQRFRGYLRAMKTFLERFDGAITAWQDRVGAMTVELTTLAKERTATQDAARLEELEQFFDDDA